MKIHLCICVFTLLLFLLNVVDSSIRCYVCNTQSGPNANRCGDEFRLTSTSTSYCDGSCRKTRGYRKSGGRDVVEITRGCVPFTERNTCYKGNHNGISADICICSEELCNTGSTVTISRWMGLVFGSSCVLISKVLS